MSTKIARRLEDRVAIITGASRGIGRAAALAFAREGAKVVVNFNKERAKAEEVVGEIEKAVGSSMLFQADVVQRDQVEDMVRSTIGKFGRLDILVNNAGVSMGGGSLLELKDDEYDPMWRINVKGVLNCTRAVAPHMMRERYGKIVNLASIAGIGTALYPGNMLYASTKAAVIILTKRFALELGRYGVNVNAVAPGLIRTEMGLAQGSSKDVEERLKYFRENSMLRRIGDPEEVANLILFLASDESSFVTGQTITIDGGRIDFMSHSA